MDTINQLNSIKTSTTALLETLNESNWNEKKPQISNILIELTQIMNQFQTDYMLKNINQLSLSISQIQDKIIHNQEVIITNFMSI